MVEAPDSEVHRLVVTGPARERLYERFVKLFAGRQDVIVVKDARLDERRRRGRPVASERRHGERRRDEPDWLFPPETLS